MKNVRTTNNIYSFVIFLSLLSFFNCSRAEDKITIDVKKKKENANHLPLEFNTVFETYGNKTLAFNKQTTTVDILTWKNHETDSIAYFNINLQNLKKESFVIKTSLVATKIPFLIKYQKLKKVEEYADGTKREYINLNIVHQFNTVYIDSMIFKLYDNADFPALEQAFRVSYQKVGGRSICQLPTYKNYDTIDISNPKNEHICCIERK
ncbi:MAG: hypothetical protein WCY77_11760 [Weeksellaceae bacterium]